MTSKQRAYLKSLASNLNPVFQVGKSSLTPELTEAIREAFNKNELIKVAVRKTVQMTLTRLHRWWQRELIPNWYRLSERSLSCISRIRTSPKFSFPDK